METGMAREDRWGRNRDGNGEMGGRHEQGGHRGPESKGVCCWRMCQSTGSPTRGKVPIRFGNYNICNGRDGGLELALRGMSQANMNLGIFQETKVTDRIYNHG